VNALASEHAELLKKQRQIAQRALGQGRRWYLRAVLMMVIGVIAGLRGGQLYYTLGVIMVILAGIAASMGRSMRRGARESLEKIDLMEHTSSDHIGELGG
jgi:fatty acid desaturase